MPASFFHYFKFGVVALFFGVFLFTPMAAGAVNQLELEQELKNIEQQIAEYSKELAKTQSQKATLAGKIKQLQIRRQALDLQIKSATLQITELSGKIVVTKSGIADSLKREQILIEEMTAILRELNMADQSVLLSLLTAEGLSGAVDEMQKYGELAAAIRGLQKQNQALKAKLTEQKGELEDQKSDAANLLQIKSIQQAGLAGTLKEQNELLTQTKGQESNYQAILKDRKKRAAEIRSRIYELFNTGSQINFGQAVEIAKWVSGATGVRPAFLLAILTQESNLGKNVGTCNRSGDPEEKSWRVIMKPSRDQEPFKKITQELGLNTDTTPVSCPMRDKQGNQVGWGGAMGPAQFIPSTWLGYKDKVSAITGKSPANPWDIRDAFLAAGIKLKGDGADGTENGDWKAALRYFSGSVNTKYRFYADNVLNIAKQYEADIGEL